MNTASGESGAVKLLLDSDLDYLNQLIDLLHQERAALEARDVDCLQQAIAAKAALLSALESNGRQRDRHLAQLGLDASPGSWHSYLDGLDDAQAPGIRQTWQTVVDRLRLCAELTEINARIVTRTQRSVGQLLNLMRGQTDGAGLYDSLGRSRQHLDNRPITSA